jgi:hypothetical protein
MNCKSIFKKVNREMLALDILPSVFKKAKQTKSFREMTISMRKAFREYLYQNNKPKDGDKGRKSSSKLSNQDLFSLGQCIQFLTSKISK